MWPGRSATRRTTRFHPPGSCRCPPDNGREPDAPGPLNRRCSGPSETWACRGLCTGGLVYFVGNAMQVMATAWLMIELTGSAILTALVQTAVFLPMFLLSLPAGVLADVTDRRRLLVGALATQAVLVTLLTV